MTSSWHPQVFSIERVVDYVFVDCTHGLPLTAPMHAPRMQ